jgi:hypothetical protein
MNVLLAGTVLTCPQCHKGMVRSLKDLGEGEVLNMNDFESLLDDPVHKSPMRCPVDGNYYVRMIKRRGQTIGQVHTQEGWV